MLISTDEATVLLAFQVANYKSIRDPVDWQFVRGKRLAPEDAPEVGGFIPNPVTAVYGANASGKSNLVDALAFFSHAVRASFSDWGPGDGIPVHPFALDPSSRHEPTVLEAQFLHGGVRYVYGFEVDSRIVREEWLHSYPKGRRRVLFERGTDEDEYFSFGDFLQGPNRSAAELTRNNALFLSTARAANHPFLAELAGWLADRAWYAHPRNEQARFGRTTERISTQDGIRRSLLLLVRAADLGVVDFEIRTQALPRRVQQAFLSAMRAYGGEEEFRDVEADLVESLREEYPDLRLQHRASGDEPVSLPLEAESSGTRAIIALSWYALEALRAGGTLIVDEIDSSLHPNLVRELVRLFQDSATNAQGAQLVFTAHDTTLMDTVDGSPPALERDQVWITEKDVEGATSVTPLSDYRVRKGHNVRRGYLQGRFGGVPLLDPLEFAEAVEGGGGVATGEGTQAAAGAEPGQA